MNTSVDWSSRIAYVKVSLTGSDWSVTFNKIILVRERRGPSLRTWVQVDEAWLVLFSALDGSWRAVTWFFPHILHWGWPLSQCLLVCLFELAQLKQNSFLTGSLFAHWNRAREISGNLQDDETLFCDTSRMVYLQLKLRLQNSPYFCVFKYARAVKQKVRNEAENRERDWGETLKIRFFFSRLTRFARIRLLRHALPISLLILRKKPTVLQSSTDLAFYLSVEKKNYSSSHGKCNSILNADQEPITCADWVV